MSVVEKTNYGHLVFFCPACNRTHAVSSGWEFNGDMDKPTFKPSILVKTGHYMDSHKPDNGCWCNMEDAPFTCGICHSYVTDGKIQYLTDCTHSMAGQTVELPKFKE